MIKFFRKIRQKMLTENKFSNYLIYAIGEIFLVVIGILIALQINNWNESRKQSITEKEFITSLKNDLKQDKAFIKRVIKLNEPRIVAYEILNDNLQNLYNNDRKSLDSIFKIYFRSQRTFYPISGSYESAESGNQISIFQNKKLVQKVVKLYNSTYDRLIDNGRILDERWDFLSKKYSYERRTGKFREMTPEQLTEFLNDVYHHFKQLEWYLESLKLAIMEIDEINTEK
ncbi:DUF6090 family protein [Psychroserpens mesophilus]|uniref:DUF6090 family protein n=1 Tax=Psychroserpens mesophilus TaxID=325473 RepID=UPI0006938741|nr:DUF6090 family protein [Psychroserpens mesophilus]